MRQKVEFWVVLVALALGAAGGYFVGKQQAPTVRFDTDTGRSLEKAADVFSTLRSNVQNRKKREARRRSLVACRLVSYEVKDAMFGKDVTATVELTLTGLDRPLTGMKVEIAFLDQFGDDRIDEYDKIERRIEPGVPFRHVVHLNSFSDLEWLEQQETARVKMACEVSQVVYADGTVETIE